jgi:hypothetical protein
VHAERHMCAARSRLTVRRRRSPRPPCPPCAHSSGPFSVSGVGIVLVTVSGVAWRLTSHDSSTCRSMLGLGSTESVDVCTRRFVPRLPPSYGRPHHPYAAMMYPEFQYRPPPPSYQASMQEYRLRLLLLDRGNTPQIQAGIQNAVSPPPTYRSHAGSLLRFVSFFASLRFPNFVCLQGAPVKPEGHGPIGVQLSAFVQVSNQHQSTRDSAKFGVAQPGTVAESLRVQPRGVRCECSKYSWKY